MRKIKLLFAIVLCLSLFTLSLFAAEISDSEWSEIQAAVDNGEITLNDIGSYITNDTTNSKTLVFDVNGTTKIINVDPSYGSEIYNAFIGSSETNSTGTDVNLPDIKINPNVDAVEQGLEGAMGVIEVILGIIVWAIMIGMTFWTITDILFLSYPVFNEYVENNTSGNSRDGRSGGNFICKMVTKEAREAYKQANGGGGPGNGSGGNVFLIYFKKRVAAIILVAVCLYFVSIGDLGFIVRIITKLCSGIIRGVQEFANS